MTNLLAAWRAPARSTIPDSLLPVVEAHPDKTAVVFPDEELTYGRLWEQVVAVANGLTELGVERNDCVAVMMRNSADQLMTWLAASLLGAVFVPINTAYAGSYLEHQLTVVAPPVFVVDEHLASTAFEVLPRIDSLLHVVVRGRADTLPKLAGVSVHQMAGLRAADATRLKSSYRAQWTDHNAVIFTAGTTGPSKGSIATHNYLVRAAQQIDDIKDGREDDIYYTPLPLFHQNAMLLGALGPLMRGATAVIDEHFSVSDFWNRVRRHGATQLSILGPMLQMLWNLPVAETDRDNSVRICLAVPVPKELHRAIEERYGFRIVLSYGLSECVPMLLYSPENPPELGYSGSPNPIFDIRLFDEDDVEVPPGEVGEVVCRPMEPHVMFEGYWNNPEATVAAWRNQWFHTGDLARSNAKGEIAFVDRKKDYLRRRSENISSFELEQAINAHSAIDDCAVYGVPSELGEEEVMVTAVLAPGAELTYEQLIDHCVANVPYFAVPRYVAFTDSLPRGPVGRILKNELRSRGVGADTYDREAAGYVVKRRDRR
ncbi:MAG: AMP-binding protein [Actinomycetota bacterium]|nr:AMP-binding protein [Actinomycetota bacterium]